MSPSDPEPPHRRIRLTLATPPLFVAEETIGLLGLAFEIGAWPRPDVLVIHRPRSTR